MKNVCKDFKLFIRVLIKIQLSSFQVEKKYIMKIPQKRV